MAFQKGLRRLVYLIAAVCRYIFKIFWLESSSPIGSRADSLVTHKAEKFF